MTPTAFLRLGLIIGMLQACGPEQQRSQPYCEITEEQLEEHMLVLGRTGRGKSRFLNYLIRQLFLARRCVVLIDPDGDLVADILAWAAKHVIETGRKGILKRIHVIEPSPFMAQRYDPFRFWLPKSIHPELVASVMQAWLHVRADRVAQAIQHNTGAQDFEAMPRLYRILTNVLTIVGTMVDGRHLPLADAAALLDFTRPESRAIFNRVADKLPRHVRADFATLYAIFERGRFDDLLRQIESTLNRLRTVLGPVLQAVFSGSGSDPVFNFYDAFQRGDLVLINLKQTEFFGAEQAKALANILIHDAFSTALITPRDKRRGVSLIIDEAAEFISPDIAVMLRRGRKYRFSITLAAQNLESFRRKDVDLRPFVLSQPSTIVCFNQRLPDDVAMLARTLFTGALDFTPLVHEVERDGGTEFIPIVEGSVSHQDSKTAADATSQGYKIDSSRQNSSGEAVQEGWAKAENWQNSESNGENETLGNALANGLGKHQSPIMDDGKISGMLQLLSEQQNQSETASKGKTHQEGAASGGSLTQSGSTTKSNSQSSGIAVGASASQSHTDGTGESDGVSLSIRFAQIHKVIREIQKTGQLQRSIADQIERFAQILWLLKRRQAVVLRDTEVCVMEAIEVPDPLDSPEALVRAVEWVRREIQQLHSYQFVPDLSPDAESDRLRRLLMGEAAINDDVADQPQIVNHDDPLA